MELSKNKLNHAVLIRTYNRPDLLRNCLGCLVNQTFKDFNVYISDDSTNNDNEGIIKFFKKKLNIHYFKNEKQLKFSALTFNAILNRINNEKYISILDDDDEWDEERMLDVNNHLLSGKDWVTHYYKFKTNTNLKKYNDVIFKHVVIKSKKDILPNSSKYFGAPSFHTINKEIFKKIGDWDVAFKRGPCQEWFTRARMYGYKCYVIKKIYGTYLMNENSITLAGSKDAFKDEVETRLKFIKKYKPYFTIFKILITSYSSARLKNSFICKLNGKNYKENLYILFMNIIIFFLKLSKIH